ncbi:MAG: NAD-dependent epimerase/dehydratase family protein, partial [Quisquiliibacterium sp.]
MKIFVTGATGYIGGSVAASLMAAGHQVHGLVRSEARASEARARGIIPIIGSLDDAQILADAARSCDAVINAASADHRAAANALIDALAGSGRALLHTSGSSIVGTRSGGERVDAVFNEDTPFEPSPARAARVALNRDILAASARGLRTVVICPSLIYGLGTGASLHSIQVPWLIALAREHRVAKHIGPGENLWSNVHIDDLVDLYLLALAKAPAGAFYYAESAENSMREVCEAISRSLGFGGQTASMTLEEAAAIWGEG